MSPQCQRFATSQRMRQVGCSRKAVEVCLRQRTIEPVLEPKHTPGTQPEHRLPRTDSAYAHMRCAGVAAAELGGSDTRRPADVERRADPREVPEEEVGGLPFVFGWLVGWLVGVGERAEICLRRRWVGTEAQEESGHQEHQA